MRSSAPPAPRRATPPTKPFGLVIAAISDCAPYTPAVEPGRLLPTPSPREWIRDEALDESRSAQPTARADPGHPKRRANYFDQSLTAVLPRGRLVRPRTASSFPAAAADHDGGSRPEALVRSHCQCAALDDKGTTFAGLISIQSIRTWSLSLPPRGGTPRRRSRRGAVRLPPSPDSGPPTTVLKAPRARVWPWPTSATARPLFSTSGPRRVSRCLAKAGPLRSTT